MAKIVVYASPCSQLYPLIPVLQKLENEGHDVLVKASAGAMNLLHEANLNVSPVSDNVDFFVFEDWKCDNYDSSLKSFIESLVERSSYELIDMTGTLKRAKADLALVDATCLGANIAAQAVGLPSVTWTTDLAPFPAQGIPQFGQGMPLTKSALGSIKNWAMSSSASKNFSQSADEFNDILIKYNLMPISDFQGWFNKLPELLYFTCEPFEYARPWPETVHLVGPGIWEPERSLGEEPVIEDDSREVILLSLGSSYQNNEFLLQNALSAFPSDSYQLIATTCSVDPSFFADTHGAKIVRFASHLKILRKASCLICSGGLGIVQKALSCGVPVCVAPQFRCQLEVAQRVVNLNVGTRLEPKKITPSALSSSVRKAIGKKKNTEEIQRIFNSADTVSACMQVIRKVLGQKA